MLIGTKDLAAPVRDIDAKVEVITTSTDARIGKGAVRFDNCPNGEPINIKLSSDTVEDFTNLGTRPSRNLIDTKSGISYIKYLTTDGAERARYGWVLDLPPGDYIAHAENINYTGGYIYLMVVDAANNQMTGTTKYLANGSVLQAGTGTFTLVEGQRALLLDYTTSHTQEDAEKFLYEDVNLQVEVGSLPTAYEPYGTVQVGAEVKQYGKNLFDYEMYPLINYYWHKTTGKLTTSNSYSCSMLMPCKHLQGKTITQNEAVYDVATGGNGGVAFYTANTTDGYIEGVGTNEHTYTVPDNAEYFGITVPRAFADGTTIQIEIGDTETAFEPYKEPVVAKSDADGNVEGLTTYSTNTLILGETYGHDITMEASYSIEAAGDTFRCIDRLKSITLDRIGESKFFGFGICQKANIKLIDTQCATTFSTNDKFNIYFDDIKVSPQMRVTEVNRDENTGELSITTYDALNDAAAHTVEELGLTAPYTIGDVAAAIAAKLKVGLIIPALDEFNLSYETGANFDGTEKLREALNAIAEVTQTIYYMDNANNMVFKRLDKDGTAALTIDKEQYITLKSKTNRRLTSIVSATELGDNYEATTGLVGTTQYVRDNPFWELREDVAQLVDNAVAALGDMTINQFDCSWRGNYLVEPGDKLALITKDNGEVFSYLINDTITYDGALKEKTEWEYAEEEGAEHTNPTNLGDALKQTYAKVDKANKQIDIVVSEQTAQGESISQLLLDTDEIQASVNGIQETTTNAFDGINEELAKLTEKTSIAVSKEQVEIMVQQELSNGVNKVETTTGFTFNEEGLTVSKNESDISTTITEDGMKVFNNNKEVLTANNEGVKAIDLHATTYLAIGKYSRLEDYGTKKRTACYWIGG